MKISSFEDLIIWQEARNLTKYIYQVSSTGSFSKDYRFKDQIRAAAGSIMDNIAEGFGRSGNKEFVQFLYYTKGSCSELRSQAYRAFDCKHITLLQLNHILEKTDFISRKTQRFISHLKQTTLKGGRYKTTQNDA